MNSPGQSLSAKKVLVVEDDFYVASDLASRLRSIGFEVVGPCPRVDQALAAVATTRDLGAAVLDINLDGETVFPVADALERLGLPFIFATGYDPDRVPSRHSGTLVLRKPLEEDAIAAALMDTLPARSVDSSEARGNEILARLGEAKLREMLSSLQRVYLPRGAVLEVPRQAVSRVYFPLDCVLSLIVVGRDGTRIETGLIGKEGLSGFGLVEGDGHTPYELVNQIEGFTLSMQASAFVPLLDATPVLEMLARRFSRALSVQVSHTALANGRFNVQARLARWLLMIHDRIPKDTFDLTHDYLAIMLGVRRPSVTDALHILEGKKGIRSTRSSIRILDREILKSLAGEAYGGPEESYARVMELPLTGRTMTARSSLALI